MNRETKRRLARQGQLTPDGAPAAPRREPQARSAPRAQGPRTGPAQFFRDVRGELRKVAWPSRAEVVNYSSVVLFTLVVLVLLIFLLDTGFAKAVFYLFRK